MKRFLTMILVVGLMASAVNGAVDPRQIRFDTMQPTDTLVKTMRSVVGQVNSGLMLPPIDPSGRVYYVDGNKSTAGNGSSWSDAFNTLSAAMAASHADIAVSAYRKWAARNTIFIRADGITEDITALAQKTDIIGVGSDDGFAKALIVGTWIVPDTVNYMGCHFYNMRFYDDGAGGALFDIDTQSGLEFHNCLFQSAATDTIALQVEECQQIKVDGCIFGEWGQGTSWSASAIKIVNDTDAIQHYYITNNIINSAGIGIDCDETSGSNLWVIGNFFHTVGLWIDDEGDDIHVINNRAITDVDTGTSTAGYDFNLANAAANVQTGSGGETDEIPFRLQSE